MNYSDVTEAIKFLVGLNGLYYVDAEGYVKLDGTDKVVQVTNNDGSKSDLMVFQEVIKDNSATILNPFAEGLSESVSQNWLFKSFIGSYVYKLLDVTKFIVELVLNQKLKSLEDEKVELSTDLIEFISPYMTVTKKTLSDLEHIKAGDPDFMSMYYQSKSKTASFRCGIFEVGSFKKKYSTIQEKTWKYLEEVMCNILQLDPKVDNAKKMNELKYKTSVLGYPRLDAKLNLMYLLYDRANWAFELMDQAPQEFKRSIPFQVDVSTFGIHISNLPEYHKLAKAFIQPQTSANTAPKTTAATPTAPRVAVASGPQLTVAGTAPVPNVMINTPNGPAVTVPYGNNAPLVNIGQGPNVTIQQPAMMNVAPYGGVSGYYQMPGEPRVTGFAPVNLSGTRDLF